MIPRSRILRSQAVVLAMFFINATACVTYLPVDEWNIARASYEAARDADSARYVPSIWFSAEQTYRAAEKAYQDRRYETAKKLFNDSKRLCEEAENAARLARQQSGEVVP
jgi:hypothetical protein